jgi:hypothetical protein
MSILKEAFMRVFASTTVLGVMVLVCAVAGFGSTIPGFSSFETQTKPMVEIAPPPSEPGIREDVPDKYKAKYEKWKAELLSTDFGRQQWQSYSANRHFLLVIRIDSSRGMGAGTDKFTWDEDGNFVGATITLGSELDTGFPPPTYYPVLNALAPEAGAPVLRSSVIAAAKLSHEIGHVEQAAEANVKLMQLQSKLIPQYVSIFLKNGFDRGDKPLLDIERQMGGTPTSIWEDREFTSELDTMRYIGQRLDVDGGLCRVLKKVRKNLTEYGGKHEKAFEAEPELSSSACNS